VSPRRPVLAQPASPKTPQSRELEELAQNARTECITVELNTQPVLQLVSTGKTNNEIADDRYISLATVKTNLSHLSNKIGARNRVEVSAWAWDSGRMSTP